MIGHCAEQPPALLLQFMWIHGSLRFTGCLTSQGGATIFCPRATSVLTLSHTELLQLCQGGTFILYGHMRTKLGGQWITCVAQ